MLSVSAQTIFSFITTYILQALLGIEQKTRIFYKVMHLIVAFSFSVIEQIIKQLVQTLTVFD